MNMKKIVFILLLAIVLISVGGAVTSRLFDNDRICRDEGTDTVGGDIVTVPSDNETDSGMEEKNTLTNLGENTETGWGEIIRPKRNS